MKKGQVYEGIVERIEFPNKGIVLVEEENGVQSKCIVKNALPGQKIRLLINKLRKGKAEGRLLEIIEKSSCEKQDGICPHFGICGGCTYISMPYDKQLEIKEKQVEDLLESVLCKQENPYVFETIKRSPKEYEYRNKMEFSFGDEVKDGPLSLGMHKRGSFYDVVKVDRCQIVDKDYRKILSTTLAYFDDLKANFYHRLRHEGYLRHLLVRKASKTGEILIALVTTTQQSYDLKPFVDMLLGLELDGKIVGVLHTKNDSLADIVQSDETVTLYGQDYFYEELLGLKFKISEFSFFQTNSFGAEVLYQTAREYIGDLSEGNEPDKIVYDLYSGTGTIAQLMAPVSKKVIGVEIVEEAVLAAIENAKLNGLSNCEFIAGDVLKVLDEIEEKPDFIILDPPRDGIHPKAIQKIIDYGVERMIYISCKPTSLVRDLEVFLEHGYVVEKATCVDQFPWTANVETCVLLCHQKATKYATFDYTPDGSYMDELNKHASYREINEYIEAKYGYKVHSAYIAQVKRECGIEMGENYNLSQCEDYEPKLVTEEKRKAIKEALKHFNMID